MSGYNSYPQPQQQQHGYGPGPGAGAGGSLRGGYGGSPPPPPHGSGGAPPPHPGAPGFSQYGGGGGGGPGPQRNMGYGQDRHMRRPGPYDSQPTGGPPGMMQQQRGWGPPGGGPNSTRSRRSASPDYSRGGTGGGGGGPPGRGFDQPPPRGGGYGPAGGGYGQGPPPQMQMQGRGGPPPFQGGGGGGYGPRPGGGGPGFNQYGGGPPAGPPAGGGGGGYDPSSGPSARSGYGRMDLGDPVRRIAANGGPPGEQRDESEVIRQRVNRERPCRTLFVRNLKYGVPPDVVRRHFAEIGDIKTFFDLVEKRAMAFVTYYDSRAAMMAKDRMHSYNLAGRAIDVHYSLPRDADLAQGCDRDKGQGTLSILIRDAPAGQTTGVSEQEVYQRFASFGEIKMVYPSEKRPDVKFIEFFDSRATVAAFDAMNGAPLGGGTADLNFEWDKPAAVPPTPAAPPPMAGMYGRPPQGGPGGFGGPPGPPTMGGASPYGGPGPAGPGMMGGGPPAPGGPGGYGQMAPPRGAVGAGAPPAGPAAAATAAVAPGAASHGLEQAKKMQDLLANLVANQGLIANLGGAPPASGPPPPAAAAAGGPAQGAPPVGSPAVGPPTGYNSYGPPGAAGPPPPVPTAAVGAAPPPAAGASPVRPAIGSPLVHGGNSVGSPTASTLPPAVSQLLQQAGARATPPAAAGGASPLPPSSQGDATPSAQPPAPQQGAPAPAGGSTPAQVQALLAMLQAQQKSQQQ